MLSLSVEILQNTEPSAMQARSSETPQRVASALVINTKPIIMISRFPLFLKNLSGILNRTPMTAPMRSERTTCQSGCRIERNIFPPPLPLITPAIETAKPNATSATASSIATTAISVSVTGPFAPYCLITIMVAAGAVAAAIAPRTMENATSKPAAMSAP